MQSMCAPMLMNCPVPECSMPAAMGTAALHPTILQSSRVSGDARHACSPQRLCPCYNLALHIGSTTVQSNTLPQHSPGKGAGALVFETPQSSATGHNVANTPRPKLLHPEATSTRPAAWYSTPAPLPRTSLTPFPTAKSSMYEKSALSQSQLLGPSMPNHLQGP